MISIVIHSVNVGLNRSVPSLRTIDSVVSNIILETLIVLVDVVVLSWFKITSSVVEKFNPHFYRGCVMMVSFFSKRLKIS